MIANVVILGCGRSGTSIFGEFFEDLGAFRYYFEPAFSDLANIDFSAGPVAMKVPKAAPGSPMTPGLPFELSELLRLVPSPRVIFWQARHPLDAICSLRPGIEADWSHNPKPPDWRQWLDRPLIERCARHWAHINTHGYLAIKEDCAINKYEPMVRQPLSTALRTCELVGVNPTIFREKIEAWVCRVGNRKAPDAYEAKRQVIWSRPDHQSRVERWRENLKQEDLASVIPIVAPAAKLLGYDLPPALAENQSRHE